MPQTNLTQYTREERLAFSGQDKIAVVQEAAGHPLPDDVARCVAEDDSDPLAFATLYRLHQPDQDQQERSEQFFHDRVRGGW